MSGTELIAAFEVQLRAVLPSSWRLAARRRPDPGATDDVDAVFELTGPDRTRARLLVEVKRAVEPRNVGAVLTQVETFRRRRPARSMQELAVVAAPFLSPLARERLGQAGAGWFDATGNLRVQLDRPSLFIDRTGATRSPFTEPGDRRLQSLRGSAAARVVRALLDDSGRRGVRTLATEAAVGAASSSRVLDLLARDDLVERDNRSAVVSVRKRSLARRWAQDYGLTTTNDVVPALAPRGVDHLLKRLAGYRQPYALTGSAAARTYLPPEITAVAPLTLPVLYVPDAVDALDALELRRAGSGANVMLVEPFDEVAYRGATSTGGLHFVAPSQAVVDLLTGPGRSAEEADQLVDILGREDAEWTR